LWVSALQLIRDSTLQATEQKEIAVNLPIQMRDRMHGQDLDMLSMCDIVFSNSDVPTLTPSTLITALRTAVDNDGKLDKELTSYNDIFDAFKPALTFDHFEERTY
jgi:hypothetical protein